MRGSSVSLADSSVCSGGTGCEGVGIVGSGGLHEGGVTTSRLILLGPSICGGLGKSLMEVVYLTAGLIPSSLIMNPVNSTSLLANLNFSTLNTRLFLLQWERMLQILWKAPSTMSDHVMMSSTIFLKSLTEVVHGQSSMMVSVYLL